MITAENPVKHTFWELLHVPARPPRVPRGMVTWHRRPLEVARYLKLNEMVRALRSVTSGTFSYERYVHLRALRSVTSVTLIPGLPLK
jgi:hypothetical protein